MIKTLFSPNDIEILIHYYCCCDVHERIDAPAVKNTIFRFLDDGIFVRYAEKPFYKVTDKGEAWLNAILNVGYPKQAWVDNNDTIVLKK